MNNKTHLALAALLTAVMSMSFSSSALSEQSATRQMAQIVSGLNHRPSADDKATLQAIANSGSDAEKAIANAILNMEHSISSGSKEKLRMVSKDRNVPESTRELATIVQNLKHKASSADKEKLHSM